MFWLVSFSSFFLIGLKRKIKVFAVRMIFLGQWIIVKCLFPGILYPAIEKSLPPCSGIDKVRLKKLTAITRT